VRETNNPKYGDYQFDPCIQISRRLVGETNQKITPQEVAKNIAANLEQIPLVEKVRFISSQPPFPISSTKF
jgi:arginyl-tRNA synthetase